MTGRLTLCIALGGLFNKREGRQTETDLPRLGLLPPSRSLSIGCQGECSRHFTIEFPRKWLKGNPDYYLGKIESSPDKSGLLAELFLRIHHEFRQMEEASLRDIEHLMLESRSDDRPNRRLPLWLERARKLLRTQFAEQIKLSEVAAEVGVHPVHLSREFRKHFGCSVGEYLREVRIEFACEHLLASDDPPVKIASAAGFADQSHFSRTFKRLRGTTPGKYRATLKSGGHPGRKLSDMGNGRASCSL